MTEQSSNWVPFVVGALVALAVDRLVAWARGTRGPGVRSLEWEGAPAAVGDVA
jgi:hypothetical protein